VVGRKSVVVVEDSESYRQLLRIVLELDDRLVIVAEAGDARGALEAVRIHRPDFVVLDFELSDGPCGAIIPTMRELSPRTRIVVHSADPDVPCHELAADACFDKEHGALGLVDVLLGAAAA
jgi:DNA-binding NarL/FixJ family response regulator